MDNYNYDEISKKSGDLIDNKRNDYDNAINKFIKNIEDALKKPIYKLGYNQSIITDLLKILETEVKGKIRNLISSMETILNQLPKDLESTIKKYLNLNQNISDEHFFQTNIYILNTTNHVKS